MIDWPINRMSGENVRFLVNWVVNRLTGTFYPEQFGNPGRTTFVRDSGQTSDYFVLLKPIPDSITGQNTGLYYSFQNLIYQIKNDVCWYHIVLNCIDR